MRHGRFILALQGVCSVLAEVLVVCVSSISDQTFWDMMREGHHTTSSDDQLFTEFVVSFGLAIGLPLIMTTSMITVWIQRRKAWLPRKPGTIANTFLYVQDTRLLKELKDMQSLSSIQRRKSFCAGQKEYALGWFDNGKDHLVLRIDEEPRLDGYRGPADVRGLLKGE